MAPSPKKRRGRPPRDVKTTAPFSIRMDVKLRSALEREAKKTKRSLRAEIESRLRDSFEDGLRQSRRDRLAEMFGGPENFGLMLLLSMFIAHLEWTVNGVELRDGKIVTRNAHRWFNDPYTAEQVKRGMVEIMNAIGAKGDPETPETLEGYWKKHAGMLGSAIALGDLDQVRRAESEVPVSHQADNGTWAHYSNEMRLGASIKKLLTAVFDRGDDGKR